MRTDPNPKPIWHRVVTAPGNRAGWGKNEGATWWVVYDDGSCGPVRNRAVVVDTTQPPRTQRPLQTQE